MNEVKCSKVTLFTHLLFVERKEMLMLEFLSLLFKLPVILSYLISFFLT